VQHFYIGAYWGDRQTTAPDAAIQVARTLEVLARLSPRLDGWRHQGGSRAKAQSRVDTSVDALAALLLRGRNRDEVDNRVIESLGFEMSAWNGQSQEAGIAVRVGAHAGIPGLVNLIVVNLAAGETYERDLAVETVAAIAEIWDADWVTFTSHDLRSAQKPAPRTPVVGWITYLSKPRTRFASEITVVADDLTDVTETRVLAARRRLRLLGALRPTPIAR
jgi:hypothetical protein